MTGKLPFDLRLDRLAELAVRVGLGLRPGDEVILTAPVEALPLARRITEHAYKAGANLVTTIYSDSVDQLTRFRCAPESSFDVAPEWLFDGMAAAYRTKKVLRLTIFGEDPALLKGQDPARVARLNRARSVASREVLSLLTTFTVNWTIVAYAAPAWAHAMFPDLPQDEAVARLWDAIFAASRVDAPDPVAAWAEHDLALRARTKWLNERRFRALHFRGPGTDLRVGLADDHLWLGGASDAAPDRPACNPNIPTEEVFTTPHKDRVDGVVTNTKPLFFAGTLIQGICARFEAGRAVELTAETGNEVLQQVLETDEGARRLGEVALVPHSSPISQSGLLFQSTLFDENAASHIAFGQAYSVGLSGGSRMTPEQLAAHGANASLIHIDWMIGSGEVSVDGIAANGAIEPVMINGEWAATVASVN
jgi:aminopeptidase